MRKKRVFTEGAFYHVTSRTNDKIRVFKNKLGRKIMLIALQDAKDKFRFRLTNFCIDERSECRGRACTPMTERVRNRRALALHYANPYTPAN